MAEKCWKRLKQVPRQQIFEKSEPITEFYEIKFTRITEKIIVLSETEIRFELIGGKLKINSEDVKQIFSWYTGVIKLRKNPMMRNFD